ncbi:hypothetical protein [Stenotrophomonas tuberculopleuritidis]|uniref:hypothetical protein n=1 Tax=Stenotrophomonas tuberculopleuritidis TaxID=3055079 RepID=UPI0026E50772|nr:hypothetical protein [Stenotrophomonas sp. 704A1]
MAASAEEIARDIMVAAAAHRQSGVPNGDWLGTQYKALLKAVGEAMHDESKARKARNAE